MTASAAKAASIEDKENIQCTGDEEKKIIDGTKKINDEACDLMVNKTISPTYWEELAETRRLALAEVAKKNEELHEQLDLLITEYVDLKPKAYRAEALEKTIRKILDETSSDEAEEAN